MEIAKSKSMGEYFSKIDNDVKAAYDFANIAKKKGFDPENSVDVSLTKNMTERVIGLIAVVAPQIKNDLLINRLGELEKKYGRLDWRVALTMSLEITQEKFCKFKDKKEAMEIGIRFGLAYLTLGVVGSPLEGFVRLELKKRIDGKEYFCLYFSGPIRSAGGTATSVSVVVADYIRLKMGYEKYDPTEDEVNRCITEVKDFHERITNLQYLPSDEEIYFLAKNMPVQIDGDPSEKLEVSNYKNLDRVNTNLMRNGFCLVFAECFAQKAKKVYAQLQKWGKEFFEGEWDFLPEFLQIQQRQKMEKKDETNENIKPDFTFIKDFVAGRPVLTHPLAKGGFRLRYGRCRNTGLSAQAIHPATMFILNNYIAIGTQLKVERPGKATVLGSCDSIEGPIVKLKTGDVLILNNMADAKKAAKDVEEILYLGDILIPYGDFLNRAHKLVPAGYCNEWWSLETGIKEKDLDINQIKSLCLEKKLPLHPKYLLRWAEINIQDFFALIGWLKKGAVKEDKIILPFNESFKEMEINPKRVLELIGIPHRVVLNEHVIIENEWKEALLLNLGGDFNFSESEGNILDILNKKCSYKIMDKSGTTIGARMGRPEKSKMRKLIGSPQVLFPVGKEGGRLRSFQSCLEKGTVNADFPFYFCDNCKKESIYFICGVCNLKCSEKKHCSLCLTTTEKDFCCGRKTNNYKKQNLDIGTYFKNALKKLDIPSYSGLIKGVRGTSSKDHTVEYLAKGILRAKHGLYVNKDGTIRYDMTEMPITHLKAKEIGISIEELKKLGYERDIYGKEIINEGQIFELKPQDIVIPCCPETLDERCDDVLLRITKFIDDSLTKIYGAKPFYNLTSKKDLIGQLVVGLSPHTSSGIVCRIIGFSKTQVMLAHPYLHSLMRRDCFTYDTYLPIMKDRIWKNVKIGDLVEELKPDKQVDSFGTLSKKVDDYFTIGMDKNGQPMVVKINNFTKHKPSKILEIKTQDGKTLKVTESHKILILENNKLKKLIASDLKKGIRLVVPTQFNIESKDIKYIDLSKHFSLREDIMIRNVKEKIKVFIKKVNGLSNLSNFLNLSKKSFYNYFIRDSFPLSLFLLMSSKLNINEIPKNSYLAAKRDNVNLPIKIPLNMDILNIVGLYVSEGCSRKNQSKKGFYQIDFSATEKPIRERIIKTMKRYFYLKPSWLSDDHITYSSKILYELFVDILKCGRNAYEKRIPPKFMNLPLNKLKFFLQGYFDGDGSASYSDCRVACDSVSELLLQDLDFCLKRYGIFTKRYSYKKKPGPKVREFYIKKNRPIPDFAITKLIVPSNYCNIFYDKIGFSLNRKQKILRYLVENTKPRGMKILYDKKYAYPEIKEINEGGVEETYCLNVENHIVSANGLFVGQCDGDEAAIILLMDVFLNFSKKYLPAHKGGRQDEPLLLSTLLIPTEVDDMVFDMDIDFSYPLELYESALNYKNPWDVKIKRVKDYLDTEKQYEGFGFTHDTFDINNGVICSAYKSIPTMEEKVNGQLDLARKIRAVDETDVARMVIDKHFMRDIKGNLRKFSTQQFRCTDCNEKFRRPPLQGTCLECGGKILFTVAEGSVLKYLDISLRIAEKYNLSKYLRQNLLITKYRIEALFGKEKDKQKELVKWFN
ncbi:DNA polymerase II large subunit [Candidatus Woesearchaeota archaeon]|nr:DNA polymerase II large subunit [Candidatus Woesearchaeota archaeon]